MFRIKQLRGYLWLSFLCLHQQFLPGPKIQTAAVEPAIAIAIAIVITIAILKKSSAEAN